MIQLLRACTLHSLNPFPLTRSNGEPSHCLSSAQALTWGDTAWGGLREGHATAQPAAIFGRMEGDFVTEPAPAPAAVPAGAAKAGGKKVKAAAPAKVKQ
jgi:hypothetical protein